MKKLVQSVIYVLLLCFNASYAECVTNRDERLDAIGWIYKAMAATYELNFKMSKDSYVQRASIYYTPAMWTSIYNQLEQQKVFETIINREGILTLVVESTPYANPVSDGWDIVIQLQNRIILSDHVDNFLPLRTLRIHVIKDTSNCLLIDSITTLH